MVLVGLLSLVAALLVLAQAPAAEATVTVGCGTIEHGGNTVSDHAWAYWGSVNDPDCEVRAAAKCGTTPTSSNGQWYYGSYKKFGSTSTRYCPGEKPELQTWGFGWRY